MKIRFNFKLHTGIYFNLYPFRLYFSLPFVITISIGLEDSLYLLIRRCSVFVLLGKSFFWCATKYDVIRDKDNYYEPIINYELPNGVVGFTLLSRDGQENFNLCCAYNPSFSTITMMDESERNRIEPLELSLVALFLKVKNRQLINYIKHYTNIDWLYEELGYLVSPDITNINMHEAVEIRS
jgi:hypothetical protein